MPATMQGMNIEEVRTYAGQVTTDTGNVENIVQQLLNRADALEWFGTDAENFKGDQVAGARTVLTNLTTALQTMAETLNKNVTEQETASGS